MLCFLQVSYKQEKTPLLSLEIPIQDVAELSRSAVQDHPDTKKPKLDGINSDLASVKVSLMSCFERFFDPEIIEDYYSAFLRARGQVCGGKRGKKIIFACLSIQ